MTKNKKYNKETSKLIKQLDKVKDINPLQKIIVETPSGCLEVILGDALIYDDPYGNIVIDSE